MGVIEDEFAAMAIEMIDEFAEDGPNMKWVSLGDIVIPDVDKPWRDDVTNRPKTITPVKILTFPDELEDRQFLSYFKGTTVPKGQYDGYMYPYAAFVPKLDDYILRPLEHTPTEDETIALKAIDPIRYYNKTILYAIEFGR